MNTNLTHNLLNVAAVLVAVFSLPEVMAFFSPETAVKIGAAIAAAKLVINTLRDGPTGLVKNQPPVE